MMLHLKVVHFYTDEWKRTQREELKTYWSFFIAFEKSMRMVKQWMLGRCISFHGMSHACHHLNGLVCFTNETREFKSHILHISKQSRKDPDTLCMNEGLVLDARMLGNVLQEPMFIMKSIPHGCCLALSKASKDALIMWMSR